MSTAEEVISTLLAADLAAVQRELRHLREIRDWAVAQTGFADGDRVIIDEEMPCPGGWAHKAEGLQGGAATIQRLDFDARSGRWYADVVLDREWSVSTVAGETRRYWKGPVAETPPGMEPPSAYDQERHPEGRKHTFMVGVRWLRAEQPEGADRG